MAKRLEIPQKRQLTTQEELEIAEKKMDEELLKLKNEILKDWIMAFEFIISFQSVISKAREVKTAEKKVNYEKTLKNIKAVKL